MRIFLLIIVCIIYYQSLTKAENISDFEIEGMSIGDSALDFINKNYLLEHKKDWFKSDEFSVSADMDLNFLNTYDAIQLIYRSNDNNFRIEGIEAIKFYEKNIEDCNYKFNEIFQDIKDVFQSVEIFEKRTLKHDYDQTGKSIVTDQTISTSDSDLVVIACYDWSKETGFSDQLRISIRTKEYDNFLINAY